MPHEYQPSVDDAWAGVKSKIREIAGDDEDKVLAIQKIVQSESDRRVQRAVDKFRSETLPQHVAKEIQEREGRKPEEILRRKEAALEFAARTGLEYQTVAKILIGDAEPEDILSALEEDINTVKINHVEQTLKVHGVNPPKGGTVWDGSLTRNDLRRMSPEQISKAMAGGRLDSMLRGGR